MLEILYKISDLWEVQHTITLLIVLWLLKIFIRTKPAYIIKIINIIIFIIVVLESYGIVRDILLYIKGSWLSFRVTDIFKESMDWGAGFVSGVLYIIFLVCLWCVVSGRFWEQDKD